ncbi:MAG: type II toxin-antitoxin system Phd/YefM family antitoxin [Chloroflexi bacterium]|nr:type II toxin-antitoxin system Phd/YefM family antitoxin [Chloroflexota bacterium]
MKILEVSDATAPLSEYIRGIEDEPVIVTVKGKPVAAIVSIENADIETASLSANPRFLALIERSRARLRERGGISSEDMRRKFNSR